MGLRFYNLKPSKFGLGSEYTICAEGMMLGMIFLQNLLAIYAIDFVAEWCYDPLFGQYPC